MAYELDSEMRTRLVRHYQQVSDQELLDAAVRAGDLTPTAQEVVHAELGSRGLGNAWVDPRNGRTQEMQAPADPFGTARRELPKPIYGSELPNGMVALTTFSDTTEARQFCEALEQNNIEVDVRDISASGQRSGSFYGGPPIALQIVVRKNDRERAGAILDDMLGIKPEIAEPDAPEDDGTVATVGQFARRADAEEVARVLTEAKVWNRITANPDGSAETEDAFLVEVREVDLVGAGELVEKALNLPEA